MATKKRKRKPKPKLREPKRRSSLGMKTDLNRHGHRKEKDYGTTVKLDVSKRRGQSRNIRDIAPLPIEQIDWKRRCDCREDLKLFLETYMEMVFELEWATDHLDAIELIQYTILKGGMFCLALPRGYGKTAIAQGAVIWAAVYGHRNYIVWIGDEQGSADESLESIRTELFINDHLRADFPEVCWPIVCCGNKMNLVRYQLYNRQNVETVLGVDELRLGLIFLTKEEAQVYKDNGCGKDLRKLKLDPIKMYSDEIERSSEYYMAKSAGAVIFSKGISGGIRGETHKHPLTGELRRPDLFVADDVQTDKVAGSPSSVTRVVRHMDGAVKGLAGPRESISGFMLCTVIQPGDVSDTYLDPIKKPEWKGQRRSMVIQWPKGVTETEILNYGAGAHWQEYSRLRLQSLRQKKSIKMASDYYLAHRDEMDDGFVTSWDQNYNASAKAGGMREYSSQQHAMELRLTNAVTFASEYQNKPMREIGENTIILTVQDILKRIHPTRERGVIPREHFWSSIYVDLQDEMMWWAAISGDDKFNTFVVDYNTYPPLYGWHITKREAARMCRLSNAFLEAEPAMREHARRTASDTWKAPFEAKIRWGLEQIWDMFRERPFLNEEGSPVQFKIGIDSQWGRARNIVYQFCMDHRDARIIPCHGKFIGATSKQFNEYTVRPTTMVGDHWMLGPSEWEKLFHLLIDTNYWKSFLHARLASPPGTPGEMNIFHEQEVMHEMLAMHLVDSEYCMMVESRGRRVEEWQVYPDKPDNDLLDCLAGALCLGSTFGVQPKGQTAPLNKKKKSVRERYAQRKAKGKTKFVSAR